MSSIGARIAFTTTILCLAQLVAAQGSLTPPAGAPAPNMKSLDQIFDAIVVAQDLVTDTQTMVDDGSRDANRTPIRAADLPFVITVPGSYYLADSATIAQDAAGITISTNNVTLDLNGHTLTGPGKAFASANGAAGVRIDGNHVTIKNGHLAQWPEGGVLVFTAVLNTTVSRVSVIDCGTVGIGLNSDSRVENCYVRGSGGHGIVLAEGARVHACQSVSNANAGIRVGSGAVVTESIAKSNGGNGYVVESDGRVENCLAQSNTGNGFLHPSDKTNVAFVGCTAAGNLLDGIVAGHNAAIIRCQSMSNKGDGIWIFSGNPTHARIEDCTIFNNEIAGIRCYISAAVTITNCTVANSASSGIIAGNNSTIRGNMVRNSGIGEGINNGAGIWVYAGSLVSENHCVGNDVGIFANDGTNYIARNTLRGNNVQQTLNGSLQGAGALTNVLW